MFNNIGSGELLIILLVLLFLFGGKKLPELARGLGEAAREVKKVKNEIDDTINDVIDDNPSDTSSNDKVKGGEKNNA